MGAIKILNPVINLENVNLSPTKHLTISDWPEEDRPREKLLKFGARNLTDIELLTILIGNGTIDRTAHDLARDLYEIADKSLIKLSNLSFKEFQKVKGIGKTKSIIIKAALELSTRILTNRQEPPTKIADCKQAYNFFKPILFNLPHEEFWIVCLNTRNEVISRLKIGEGTNKKVIVDIKQIISHISDVKAHVFVCAHNHPSGSLAPSEQDISLTKKLSSAAQCVETNLVDHIIVAGDGFFSFQEAGYL
jgi:DNA repair protein RadC